MNRHDDSSNRTRARGIPSRHDIARPRMNLKVCVSSYRTKHTQPIILWYSISFSPIAASGWWQRLVFLWIPSQMIDWRDVMILRTRLIQAHQFPTTQTRKDKITGQISEHGHWRVRTKKPSEAPLRQSLFFFFLSFCLALFQNQTDESTASGLTRLCVELRLGWFGPKKGDAGVLRGVVASDPGLQLSLARASLRFKFIDPIIPSAGETEFLNHSFQFLFGFYIACTPRSLKPVRSVWASLHPRVFVPFVSGAVEESQTRELQITPHVSVAFYGVGIMPAPSVLTLHSPRRCAHFGTAPTPLLVSEP